VLTRLGVCFLYFDFVCYFQSIFEWSKIPMDFIDASFYASTLAAEELPAFNNLISGIVWVEG
jgi:ferrous iron transport protein B